MQHKLLNLVTKSAKQSKAQVFSAVQPSRYLKDLNKQQVGQGKTVLITGASSGIGEGRPLFIALIPSHGDADTTRCL